jgi:hypothetical protein
VSPLASSEGSDGDIQIPDASLRCLVRMLMKEEKFSKGCPHKAAQVSRIHAYLEDLEGQEA